MTIGEKIELLCNRLGIQKKELADRVGITPQHLSGIISGKKNPSLQLLKKMSEIFGGDADLLDANAFDVKDNQYIMERLPADIRDWVLNENSRPYIVFAKMISENKLTSEELTSLIKIIRSDKDGQKNV